MPVDDCFPENISHASHFILSADGIPSALFVVREGESLISWE